MKQHKEPMIIWEKWVDPMGGDEDSNDFLRKQEDYEESEAPIIKSKTMKMIVTPMGMIPYTENTASSSIFNFWVGHCNFDISSPIVSIIEETDGVETLDVFTRYRFRIGVGKAFDDGLVMRTINSILYKHFDYDKSTTNQ